MAFSLLRAGARVSARRLVRGPRHPAWTWTHETLAQFVRDDLAALARLDLPTRRAFRERSVRRSRILERVERERVDLGGVASTWFTPRHGPHDRVVFYLHGGGYVSGSALGYSELIARVALASAARALAVDYRLAPEHPFPAALDDATAAWRALVASGVDPSRVVVAGDSAGGGLALALLVAIRDGGGPLPAAGALLSPWLDLGATGATIHEHREYDYLTRDLLVGCADAYLAGADPGDPRASPLHADLAGLCPLLVQVGGAEALLDDSRRLVARARAAGIGVDLDVAPHMVHVWHFFAALLPESRSAIDRVGAFVRSHTPDRA